MTTHQDPDERRVAHLLRVQARRRADEQRVITPSRVIPAGQPLPTPPDYGPPPAPPPPPDWWTRPPAPPAPRPPVTPPAPPTIHVQVDVHLDDWLPVPAEPEPGPPWWTRCRPGYNAVLILVGFPLTMWWADVLAAAREDISLAGAWVIALIPLTICAFADNVYRVAAAGAADELWAPKIRAAVARLLLWSVLLATLLALPLTTVIYTLTGVRP